eukprot:jgi/Mesvir1/9100/Mv03842-RA.1
MDSTPRSAFQPVPIKKRPRADPAPVRVVYVIADEEPATTRPQRKKAKNHREPATFEELQAMRMRVLGELNAPKLPPPVPRPPPPMWTPPPPSFRPSAVAADLAMAAAPPPPLRRGC